MAIFRLLCLLLICATSFTVVDATIDTNALGNYLEFCKSLLGNYGLSVENFASMKGTTDYNNYIEDCLAKLEEFGLGGNGVLSGAVETYIRACLEAIGTIKGSGRGAFNQYLEFCKQLLAGNEFEIGPDYLTSAGGKGLSDYLEFCKEYLTKFGLNAGNIDYKSDAYSNYIEFCTRILSNYQIDGVLPRGYIKKCLEIISTGGSSFSALLEQCKSVLTDAGFGRLANKLYGNGLGKPIRKLFSGFGNNAWGGNNKPAWGGNNKPAWGGNNKPAWGGWSQAQANAETTEVAATQSASGSGSSTVSSGLMIGLLVVVCISLVSNLALLAIIVSRKGNSGEGY